MKPLIVFFVALWLLLSAGCDEACQAPMGSRVLHVGDTVEVVVDSMYWVAGAQFGFTYAMLKDDSRCPVNVKCIWAGDAKVLFNLTCVDNVSVLELHHNAEFKNSADMNGVVVKLLDILPYKYEPDTLVWHDYHPIITIGN